MTSKTSQSLQRVRKQAADWVVLLHTREDINSILPIFVRWVNADPTHRPEFKRVNTLWESIEDLGDRGVLGPTQGLTPFAPAYPFIAPRSWRRPVMVASALTAIGACVLGVYHFISPAYSSGHTCATASPTHQTLCTLSQGQYASDYGKSLKLELSDGSQISLDSNSQVTLDVTAQSREVHLDRGEGLFQVKAAAAPFIVDVGPSAVRALGTTFSIEKEGPDSSQTVVVDGRVSIKATDRTAPVVLEAGQAAEIRDGEVRLVKPTPSRVDARVSWTSGVLSFDSEALAVVVEKFNRYNRRKLRVDSKIAQVHISGLFASNNPDGFAMAVEDMLGIKRSLIHDAQTDEDVIYLHGPVVSNDRSLQNK